MQTIYADPFNSLHFHFNNPNFCPKRGALNPPNKPLNTAKKVSLLRTSFSESTLNTGYVPKKDISYTIIATLEAEFFDPNPPFFFTFDDSMFLFLWAIDRIRKGEGGYMDDSQFNQHQIETWRSLLKYAETIFNKFLEMTPRLNSDDYIPNIKMIAILIAMKFYYDDPDVYDADLIRAFYFSRTGFKLHEMDKIAKLCVNCIEVGITVSQIKRMESVFIATIFKHSIKEASDDTGERNVQTNSARSFGSSSI